MTPSRGERVTLLVPLGDSTQRVTGTVLEVFDDVRETDESTSIVPTVRIRRDGETGEDVWEAPVWDCRRSP